MDYEKKYKEALERARQALDKIQPENQGVIKLIKDAFPELAESEDERIRKELIGALMWQRDCLDAKCPHDNNLILPGFTMKVGVILRWLEKQKKQKPGPISCGHENGSPEECSPTKEQMVALSWAANGMLDNDSPSAGDIKARLRSLYNGLQPKSIRTAEWSEEDEEMLNSIIKVVCGIGEQPSIGLREKQVRFLKSLRPSWKPSEEQVQALEFVIKDYREDSCNATANYLQEILDHLKNM